MPQMKWDKYIVEAEKLTEYGVHGKMVHVITFLGALHYAWLYWRDIEGYDTVTVYKIKSGDIIHKWRRED